LIFPLSLRSYQDAYQDILVGEITLHPSSKNTRQNACDINTLKNRKIRSLFKFAERTDTLSNPKGVVQFHQMWRFGSINCTSIMPQSIGFFPIHNEDVGHLFQIFYAQNSGFLSLPVYMCTILNSLIVFCPRVVIQHFLRRQSLIIDGDV